MVQSFHKVIHSIIIGVVGQIGSYAKPPGQVIAGGFALVFTMPSKVRRPDAYCRLRECRRSVPWSSPSTK